MGGLQLELVLPLVVFGEALTMVDLWEGLQLELVLPMVVFGETITMVDRWVDLQLELALPLVEHGEMLTMVDLWEELELALPQVEHGEILIMVDRWEGLHLALQAGQQVELPLYQELVMEILGLHGHLLSQPMRVHLLQMESAVDVEILSRMSAFSQTKRVATTSTIATT